MSEFGSLVGGMVAICSGLVCATIPSPSGAETADGTDTAAYYFTHQKDANHIQRGIIYLPRSTASSKGKLESAYSHLPFPGTSHPIEVTWLGAQSKSSSLSFEMNDGKYCELTASKTGEGYVGSCSSIGGRRESFNASLAKRLTRNNLEGRFSWVTSQKKEKEIDREIETVTASMSFFVRPFARNQLKFLLRPSKHFEFRPTTNGIHVKSDSVSRHCFFDGRRNSFLNRRKERTSTKCSVFGVGLQEYFYGDEDGTWVHSFTLSKDGGRLCQTIYVNYPGFSRPLQITLTFHRDSATTL